MKVTITFDNGGGNFEYDRLTESEREQLYTVIDRIHSKRRASFQPCAVCKNAECFRAGECLKNAFVTCITCQQRVRADDVHTCYTAQRPTLEQSLGDFALRQHKENGEFRLGISNAYRAQGALERRVEALERLLIKQTALLEAQLHIFDDVQGCVNSIVNTLEIHQTHLDRQDAMLERLLPYFVEVGND